MEGPQAQRHVARLARLSFHHHHSSPSLPPHTMTPSSQDIVNEANKKIEDVIRVNVLGATGDDRARGQAWYDAIQQLRAQLVSHTGSRLSNIKLTPL